MTTTFCRALILFVLLASTAHAQSPAPKPAEPKPVETKPKAMGVNDEPIVTKHEVTLAGKPFKYTATMQEKNPTGNPKLIRIETNSGHGASNLAKTLEETADMYAFVWKNIDFIPKYPK